jgi:hypothetical protein
MSDTSPKDAVQAVAYYFELATRIKYGVYSNWSPQLNLCPPNVPEGSVRNLKPLFDSEAISQVRKQALLEAAEICDQFDACDPKYIKEAIRKLAEEE